MEPEIFLKIRKTIYTSMTIFKKGDIFCIAINVNEVGFGQIIHFINNSFFLFVVFNKKEQRSISYNLDRIYTAEILLMGNTNDSRLLQNTWEVIGNNIHNIINIRLPYYKLGILTGSIFIADHTGKRLRKATPKESNGLNHRVLVAPIRFENALRAYFGQDEWIPDYEKLLYRNCVTEIL